MFRSHGRNPEGVTNFADREPLPKSPAEIRQRPLAPNSDFLEELSECRLAKYTGQSTRKPPQASVGRFLPFANVKLLPIAATTGIACMASHLCPEVNGRVTKSR